MMVDNEITLGMEDREIAYARAVSVLLYESNRTRTFKRILAGYTLSVVRRLKIQNLIKRILRSVKIEKSARKILKL